MANTEIQVEEQIKPRPRKRPKVSTATKIWSRNKKEAKVFYENDQWYMTIRNLRIDKITNNEGPFDDVREAVARADTILGDVING